MTQTRQDAVDILAFLASRNPGAFRQMMDETIGFCPAGFDPHAIALASIAAIVKADEASPEAVTAARFAAQQRFLGRSVKQSARWAEVVLAALRSGGVELLDAVADGEPLGNTIWEGLIVPRFGDAAVNVPTLWKGFKADADAADRSWEFGFESLIPELPTLKLAGLAVGGFMAGKDSKLVLADLPFSPFAVSDGSPGSDPVLGAVMARLPSCKAASAFLFRIDWTVAERLGFKPKAYESMVRAALPGFEVRSIVLDNERFVPMGGKELFVAAARKWTCEFKTVTVGSAPVKASSIERTPLLVDDLPADTAGKRFPAVNPDRIHPDYAIDPSAAVVPFGDRLRRLTPYEVADILGLKDLVDLPWPNSAAYGILGRSAPLPVAERALRSLLRSVELV